MPFSVRLPIDDRDLRSLFVEVCTPSGVTPRRRARAAAFIDTSSTLTRIRADLAARLALPLAGVTRFAHPACVPPPECLTVQADVVLRGEDHRIYTLDANLVVAPSDMEVALLLGMDCLLDGVLTVHLRDRWWSFRAPPDREA